jgi:uncharacterized membrane protein YfcA
LLSVVAISGSWAGAKLAARADASKLQTAFTALPALIQPRSADRPEYPAGI